MIARVLLAVGILAASLQTVSGAAPQRIISGAPSITEMLYAIGLGDRVVGVTEFCHYPVEVRDKPKIGSYLRPSIETILAMKPDLAVILEEHGELQERLRRVGVETLAVSHNDLAGIYASLHAIGERTGASVAARQKVAETQAALEAIEQRAAGLPRRSTMFVVGRSPGTVRDLFCAGSGSFLDDLITIAGGDNIFGEAGQHYPRIPREEILARRPEVVIDMGDMSDTDNVTEAHRLSVGRLWKQAFPDLPAVRHGRVYPVAKDIFVVPGPRVVEAAQTLFRMIHPEAQP